MSVVSVYKKYPTNEACLAKVEQARWGDRPCCSYCKSNNVSVQKADSKRNRRRWFCGDCRRSFSATVNTIFHGTRLPLQKWFLAVSILVNAKKSVSSHQLARDLDLPIKTAYSLSQRIRKAMLGTQMPILRGIVEMDETYIGGKPRRKGVSKRGRGTNKMPVLGAVERGGKVVARPLTNAKTNAYQLRSFMLEAVKIDKTHLISDDYRGYKQMGKFVAKHSTINHQEAYVVGDIHTNTIEGFWATVKRAHYGQHHSYTRRKAHLYIGEACYKYNNRKDIDRKHGDKVADNLLETMACTDL